MSPLPANLVQLASHQAPSARTRQLLCKPATSTAGPDQQSRHQQSHSHTNDLGTQTAKLHCAVKQCKCLRAPVCCVKPEICAGNGCTGAPRGRGSPCRAELLWCAASTFHQAWRAPSCKEGVSVCGAADARTSSWPLTHWRTAAALTICCKSPRRRAHSLQAPLAAARTGSAVQMCWACTWG